MVECAQISNVFAFIIFCGIAKSIVEVIVIKCSHLAVNNSLRQEQAGHYEGSHLMSDVYTLG